MSKHLEELIKKWEATGRLATIYPRKERVSLNGSRSKTYNETYAYLVTWAEGQIGRDGIK